MTHANPDAPQKGGINPKLVNLLVVLGIICAIAFLALWAVPQLSQNASVAKEQSIVDSNSEESAAKALQEYIYTEVYSAKIFEETFDYKATYIEDPHEAVNMARASMSEKRAAFLADTYLANADKTFYFFELAPTYKSDGGACFIHQILFVYKDNDGGEWQIK